MRIRVEYKLSKPLMKELKVKIKGRGTMAITPRYENVLHFCFRCGRIGHATPNCEENELEDMGIKFGEELRASPPRRAQEIAVNVVSPRVIKPLFQVDVLKHVGAHAISEGNTSAGRREIGESSYQAGAVGGGPEHGHNMGHHQDICMDLVDGVKDLHVVAAQLKLVVTQEVGAVRTGFLLVLI
jgi:hypothetical protein